MVIEYARHEAGLADASSTEFDPETSTPVIATMAEQVDIIAGGDLGGTMRLGLYPAHFTEGSLAAELYGAPEAPSATVTATRSTTLPRADRGRRPGLLRHLARRHAGRVRRAAARVHPFYIGTQAHPELRSRPTDAHPLFAGLVGAAIERNESSGLFDPETESVA